MNKGIRKIIKKWKKTQDEFPDSYFQIRTTIKLMVPSSPLNDRCHVPVDGTIGKESLLTTLMSKSAKEPNQLVEFILKEHSYELMNMLKECICRS